MVTAILDTNIFVRAAIRYPVSASSRVLDAYYDGKYHLVFSPSTRDELLDILLLPHIRARLGWSDDELLRFLTGILVHAFVYDGQVPVPASLTRDVSDTKFLALAQEAAALLRNRRRVTEFGGDGNHVGQDWNRRFRQLALR